MKLRAQRPTRNIYSLAYWGPPSLNIKKKKKSKIVANVFFSMKKINREFDICHNDILFKYRDRKKSNNTSFLKNIEI